MSVIESNIESNVESNDTPVTQYGGPHPWQIQPWARLIRSTLRQREYFRWTNKYCTSLSVKGLEHLETLQGPAIFAPNHQSHMDTPVLMSGLPETIQNNLYFGAAADRWFVKGKRKLILQPWYQSLGLGTFPIVRGGGSKALDYAKWLIDQQCNLCIFPEGTRSTSDELGQFRHGVSIMAIEKQIPVVPVVLKGLRELRAKGAEKVTQGSASVTFLPPIYPSTEFGVETSTKLIRDAMNREFFREIPFPGNAKTSGEFIADASQKSAKTKAERAA